MDTLHIQKRILWRQLTADAAFDLTLNREARAVFRLFIAYLKRAKLRPKLFEGSRGTDMVTGIEYYNTYIEPIKYPRLVDMHVLSCAINKFAKIERDKSIRVILAIHDDLDSRRGGEYYGFKTDQNKSIIIYAYQEAQDPHNPQEFTAQDLKDLLMQTDWLSQAESTFVHEYIHFADDIGARQKSPLGNRSRTIQPEEDYKGYINDVKEINARYAQWILNIVESFSRLLAVKQDGIAKRFPRFDEFWHFYWDQTGFVPPELKRYASPATKKRLTKRLYKFYDWIKTQEKNKKVINDTSAINFAKKQIIQELTEDQKEGLKNPGRFDVVPRY